jgi:hypothetical protein
VFGMNTIIAATASTAAPAIEPQSSRTRFLCEEGSSPNT